MTETFDMAIAELRAQRERIDTAIAALEGLGAAGGGAVQTRITAGWKTEGTRATAGPKARMVGKKVRGQKSAAGSATKRTGRAKGTTYELVKSVLSSGPKRPGAIIAALKGKATASAVYVQLSYLKGHGETRVGEDGAHELIG